MRCSFLPQQLSDDLLALVDAFTNARVPERWMAVSVPTLRPLAAWMTDLQVRIDLLLHMDFGCMCRHRVVH